MGVCGVCVCAFVCVREFLCLCVCVYLQVGLLLLLLHHHHLLLWAWVDLHLRPPRRLVGKVVRLRPLLLPAERVCLFLCVCACVCVCVCALFACVRCRA